MGEGEEGLGEKEGFFVGEGVGGGEGGYSGLEGKEEGGQELVELEFVVGLVC